MRVQDNASTMIMDGLTAKCTNCGHKINVEAAARRVTMDGYMWGREYIACPECGADYHPISGGGCGHYVQAQRFKRKRYLLQKQRRWLPWIEQMHRDTYVHGWRGYRLYR